jgi:PPOX class probable F420-dependent enzyme
MHPALQPANVQAFLVRPLLAKLVTLNPSGSPQVTFMWFILRDGGFLFSTTQERIKFRNLAADSRAAVAIDDPQDMRRGVIANGAASVTPDNDGAFLRGISARYSAPITEEQARERAAREKRAIIRLTPSRVRTIGF